MALFLKHTALCTLVIENKRCLHKAAAGSHTVGNLCLMYCTINLLHLLAPFSGFIHVPVGIVVVFRKFRSKTKTKTYSKEFRAENCFGLEHTAITKGALIKRK